VDFVCRWLFMLNAQAESTRQRQNACMNDLLPRQLMDDFVMVMSLFGF
jgi:hypothetical protein